jgi:hypothetical protein
MDGSGLATAYVVVADIDLWVFVVLAVAVFVGSSARRGRGARPAAR